MLPVPTMAAVVVMQLTISTRSFRRGAEDGSDRAETGDRGLVGRVGFDGHQRAEAAGQHDLPGPQRIALGSATALPPTRRQH